MRTRTAWRTLAGIALLVPASLVAAARPNILLVLIDDLGHEALGAYGGVSYATPALDALAASGVRFTHTYATPLCAPSRVQLMTGRYGHATGVVHNDLELPASELTIAEVLADHGYATGYIGKWHLAGNREDPVPVADRQGWDYWAVRNCSHDHFQPTYWLGEAGEPVREKGWEPDVQTRVQPVGSECLEDGASLLAAEDHIFDLIERDVSPGGEEGVVEKRIAVPVVDDVFDLRRLNNVLEHLDVVRIHPEGQLLLRRAQRRCIKFFDGFEHAAEVQAQFAPQQVIPNVAFAGDYLLQDRGQGCFVVGGRFHSTRAALRPRRNRVGCGCGGLAGKEEAGKQERKHGG